METIDAEPFFEAALNEIGADPTHRAEFKQAMASAVWQYQVRPGIDPKDAMAPSDVRVELERIAKAADVIHQSLSRISIQRRAAYFQSSGRVAGMTGAHESVLRAVLTKLLPSSIRSHIPAAAISETTTHRTDMIFHDPWASGGFHRFASAVRSIATDLPTDDLARRNSADPHFDELIARLADIFQAATGRPASGKGHGTARTYRPPFCRFVAKVWLCLANEKAPSNDRIADALSRSGKSLPKNRS